MLKKFLVGGLMAFVLFASASMAMADATVTYVGGTTVFEMGDTTSRVFIYDATDATTAGFLGQFTTDGSATLTVLNHAYKGVDNSYRYLTSSDPSISCATPLSYADCDSAVTATTLGEGTLTFDYDQMYDAGVAGFTSVTSFSFATLIAWAGDNVKQILGGGLGLVDGLIGWIIAIIIITVIVRLIFHGLRWLHILR